MNSALRDNINKNYWTINSETIQGVRYLVERNIKHNQIERQFSCQYIDFRSRNLSCKHVYTVVFHYFSTPSPTNSKNSQSTDDQQSCSDIEEQPPQANFEERPQSGINDQLQINIENQSQFNAAEQSQSNTTELLQQAQLTTEDLISNIQSLTRALDDLDINRLQVVHDQLSRVISDVRRQERNFQNGDWVGENQRVKFLPNMGFNKQQR
ncbi:15620_t:CDS:1 [Cetraspora pellucida]|uniref:15620_t:CDS:1 n=1 Tax=Cetraspora pellucida TaxID=1433469 RepID=A0ACA9NAU6_9GLOM|nr:15620_t:CDS:1 [Cetraspora pellucida]